MAGLSAGWFAILAVLAAVIGFTASGPGHTPSPLLHAAFKGDLGAVQQLLPVAPELSAAARADRTPAQLDLDRSFADRVRKEANERDQWNNTALHWAAKGGSANSVQVVKHLLSAGTDALAQNNAGSTALHWACTVADPSISRELVTLLLSRGLYVDAPNGALETPLHWAVDWSRPHAVELLLAKGADPKRVDVHGNSPLHKVKKDCDEREDCTSIVSMLVKAGSDVMLQNNFKRTPLQYFNQDREQQKQAAEAGAQKAARDAAMAQQREQQQQEDADTEAASAAGASPAPPGTPKAQPQVRVTPEQLDQIKEQFEEFKKNMTEGGVQMVGAN